jgi:hypothetical protein
MEYLSKDDFDDMVRQHVYYRNRWGYFSAAIELARKRSPQTVLELGPAVLPIVRGSDTMNPDNNIILLYPPRFIHDARVIPWPIADKAYDLFIALQVWEHLGPMQREAFGEVMRIARSAVLSFPLEWTSCPPDDDHYMITEQTIRDWTLGVVPTDRIVAVDDENRLVLAFDFLEEP